MAIPIKEDYENFLEEFKKGLESIKGVSFFIYGSYLRSDFAPGISIIDGFIVLDDLFTTNKKINSLAGILINSLNKSNNNIRTKFKVLDKGTASDGRFLTYSNDYVKSLRSNAVKKYGNYNLEDMNGLDYPSRELDSIANNLNDVRKGFLYNTFKSDPDKKDFPLRKLLQLPKQLINLSEKKLIEEKDESLKKFSNMFPLYNSLFVENIVELMKDPVKYEEFFSKDENLNSSIECLTEMERMIKAYVGKFPKISDKEAKDNLLN